jgi:hypothetical protein
MSISESLLRLHDLEPSLLQLVLQREVRAGEAVLVKTLGSIQAGPWAMSRAFWFDSYSVENQADMHFKRIEVLRNNEDPPFVPTKFCGSQLPRELSLQ